MQFSSSLNVFPNLALNDAPYQRWIRFERSGHGCFGFSSGDSLPDLSDLILCPSRIPMRRASRHLVGVLIGWWKAYVSPASLHNRIVKVVGNGSEKQMVRVDAGRIVAGVTHMRPRHDSSARMCEVIRDYVRAVIASLAVNVERPVAVRDTPSGPFPAFVRCALLHSRPESSGFDFSNKHRYIIAKDDCVF